jgi:hypothetical protein
MLEDMMLSTIRNNERDRSGQDIEEGLKAVAETLNEYRPYAQKVYPNEYAMVQKLIHEEAPSWEKKIPLYTLAATGVLAAMGLGYELYRGPRRREAADGKGGGGGGGGGPPRPPNDGPVDHSGLSKDLLDMTPTAIRLAGHIGTQLSGHPMVAPIVEVIAQQVQNQVTGRQVERKMQSQERKIQQRQEERKADEIEARILQERLAQGRQLMQALDMQQHLLPRASREEKTQFLANFNRMEELMQRTAELQRVFDDNHWAQLRVRRDDLLRMPDEEPAPEFKQQKTKEPVQIGQAEVDIMKRYDLLAAQEREIQRERKIQRQQVEGAEMRARDDRMSMQRLLEENARLRQALEEDVEDPEADEIKQQQLELSLLPPGESLPGPRRRRAREDDDEPQPDPKQPREL